MRIATAAVTVVVSMTVRAGLQIVRRFPLEVRVVGGTWCASEVQAGRWRAGWCVAEGLVKSLLRG